ncbi:hypothetical protein VNI00_018785 [Paramarasmius palmivorus]|uniref:Uncharacterized protein n=1 Tax=Paramarasmius palmivorus TaxID=297713 RepID=A0AAW0ATV7_9AGAR
MAPAWKRVQKPDLDETIWDTVWSTDRWLAFCKPCLDIEGRSPYTCEAHQKSVSHHKRVTAQQQDANASRQSHPAPGSPIQTPSPAVPFKSRFDMDATLLLHSFLKPDSPARQEPLPDDLSYSRQPSPSDDTFIFAPSSPKPHWESTSNKQGFDWDGLEVAKGFHESPVGETVSGFLESVAEIWASGPDDVHSDDEGGENPDAQPDDEEFQGTIGPPETEPVFLGPAPKRARRMDSETPNEWFPWDSRLSCTLDILMHLPRSAFSVHQMELFLWLLRANGMKEVPSQKTAKQLNANLQKMFGIQTFKYKGAFGHIYYVNSFADIIAQEMANPKVRHWLSFYPEKCTGYLREARQANRWVNEMNDDELTPMIRLGEGVGARDFFIFEPAVLRDRSVWMPHRWFIKHVGEQTKFVARCWQMVPIRSSEGRPSWRVLMNHEAEFEEDELLLSFPDIKGREAQFGLLDLTQIEDFMAPSGELKPWTLTDPSKGNRWRELANGAPVYAFLIWLYCDDTSGNASKRWNEHNSFLFTAAGLNHSQSSREFNIHFLCTSNTAPPLEMMDGIVDQIQDGQTHGIWALDCKTNEEVLLIPGVLALLGDNPMQSEFACHIGLRGKLFCRACKVRGKDSKREHADDNDDSDEESSDGDDDDAGSAASDAGSVDSDGRKRPRKKFVETLDAMRQRIADFIKPGEPRAAHETVHHLDEHFRAAQIPGATQKLRELRTKTGVKDTYQMHFVNRLLNSYKGRRSLAVKTTLLNQARTTLPKETKSPVWRIRGLNPHTDTPVEVLHVVLLGFVKYLWRDVIQNQIKKKADKMAELSARLSSANVEGLGLPSFLAGDTLTNYYGSLTGGDFRKVAQVAPYVLHGLVPDDCYETWLVLSKLIPLIWQPEITDLSKYLETLEQEIQNFLVYAAKWSVRWFNKPKFHILVHLPDHIRRFGPAILFATEAFESYNAVIRCKSTHSNRQAPSRDIAFAFAQTNRLRHAVCGGLFLDRGSVGWSEEDDAQRKNFDVVSLPQSQRVTDMQLYFRNHHRNCKDRRDQIWATAGPHALQLVEQSHDVIGSYLGLEPVKEEKLVKCTFEPAEKYRPFSKSKTGQFCPDYRELLHVETPEQDDFKVAKQVVLEEPGDKIGVGSFVIAQLSRRRSVARVAEILHHREGWDVVLVKLLDSGGASLHGMPRLISTSPPSYIPLPLNKVLCAVNVQHDCIRNKCKVQQTAVVRQERHDTELRRGRVIHLGNPDDVVLNTAQMRSAKFVQEFRIPAPILPMAATLHESSQREIEIRRKQKHTSSCIPPSPRPNTPLSRPPSSIGTPNSQSQPRSATPGTVAHSTVVQPRPVPPPLPPNRIAQSSLHSPAQLHVGVPSHQSVRIPTECRHEANTMPRPPTMNQINASQSRPVPRPAYLPMNQRPLLNSAPPAAEAMARVDNMLYGYRPHHSYQPHLYTPTFSGGEAGEEPPPPVQSHLVRGYQPRRPSTLRHPHSFENG